MVKIALLGCGTVGSGVVKLLEQNAQIIEKRAEERIEIAKVFTRTVSKCYELGIPDEKICKNFEEIENDDEIQIVVELIGGVDRAYDYIMRSLAKGKHVVSANKDLIAIKGEEIFKAAQENNVAFYFDASVAGGIPIINPIKHNLSGNNAQTIMGILNGTTNYILTKMTNEGLPFETVLSQAQSLGYAEADPTSDVGGLDAARKVAILASVAFNSRVTFSDVYCEGITKIEPSDFAMAKRFGYVIKLLGIAKEDNGKIQARVHPAMIPQNHPLASVNDVYNAVYYDGDAVGAVMLYGRGAGQMPTASSVVGDVIDCVRNMHSQNLAVGCTCFLNKDITNILDVSNRFYIRLKVVDRPGVLAKLAGVFGEFQVSIATMVQEEHSNEHATLYLITHNVKEDKLRKALAILDNAEYVEQVSSVIRLEGIE